MKTEWKNKQVEAVIGGRVCKFESYFEYQYAQYLELQVQAGHYWDWEYEPQVFSFDGGQFTPDFKVQVRQNRTEWHECKGLVGQKDIAKWRAFHCDYPRETLVLILLNPIKKNPTVMHNARLYTDRFEYMLSRFRKLARQGVLEMSPGQLEDQTEYGRLPK